MKVYVENKDKMTSCQWGYDEESKRYFVKLNFDLPSNTEVKVLSLSDYTKQVRKEVVQEIKDKAYQDSEFYDLENGGIFERKTYLINEHILD